MKVVFTGGGTAGSATPLLAIARYVQTHHPEAELIFVGTRRGMPERALVESLGLPYHGVAAGKFRRYFDLRNLIDIFVTIGGFFQSLVMMYRLRPDVIVGAGGYVQVPVMWAGWVYGARLLVHQQDVVPSLSNILMLNLAKTITVTFEKSLNRFPSTKVKWIGNPVREEMSFPQPARAYDRFSLDRSVPVVVITGGGTGAAGLNSIIQQALPKLVPLCQVVHLTGAGKAVAGIDHPHYQQHEFLETGMADLLAAATVVVSRAGLSSLSELSILGKPAILVPMPNSHQEANAEYFREKQAALVVSQKDLSPTRLVHTIQSVLDDETLREQLGRHISTMMHAEATALIAQEIINCVR